MILYVVWVNLNLPFKWVPELGVVRRRTLSILCSSLLVLGELEPLVVENTGARVRDGNILESSMVFFVTMEPWTKPWCDRLRPPPTALLAT